MCTVLAGRPPIKIGGEWRPQGKGPHDDVEVRVAYALVHVPVLAKFLSDVDLREFRISSADGGWRLMLKGTRRDKHVVAFFHADSWKDLITLCATTLDTGAATWYPDLYPPKFT